MESSFLNQALLNLQNSRGSFAADWIALLRLYQDSLDLTSMCSSSTSTSFSSLQTCFSLAKSALFLHGVCFDPASGHLIEIFLTSLCRLLELDHGASSSVTNNEVNSFIRSENLRSPAVVAKYFRFALSLPLGERYSKMVFLVAEKFSSLLSSSSSFSSSDFLDAVIGSSNENSNNNNSNKGASRSLFFTRLNLAIALSRQEALTWPTRVSQRSSGQPRASTTAANTTTSSFDSWCSVILTRLRDPLGFRCRSRSGNDNNDENQLFCGFVLLPVRQMMAVADDDLRRGESAHVLAFLVLVFLSEMKNQNNSQEQQFLSREASAKVFVDWKSFIEKSLLTLTRSKKLTLDSKTISEFPSLCAM
jgi:hypothetical protein